MVQGKNHIPYWIDRRLTGLAEPEYHASISFGLPIEPEDSQYGKSRLNSLSQHAQDYLWRAVAGQMTEGSAFMPDPDSGRCCVTAKQNLDLDPDYLKAYAV